jgi:hypothetical protein
MTMSAHHTAPTIDRPGRARIGISCALGAALLLAACATKPSQPDWIDGTSQKYGSAHYLTGRGQASNAEDARDRARADLAKVFEVAVTVESEDVQAFRTATGASPQYEAQVSRRIGTRTEQIVRGIQIGDQWQDPTTKTYYALAVLPRLQTATSLRQDIDRLDEATRNDVERARRQEDILTKIAAAHRALEAQVERGAYQKSLKIVDPTGRGVEPQWNTAKLSADLSELLKRVRIAPRIVPGSAEGFDHVVRGAIAAAGFLAETGQNPDFLLEARLQLDDLGRLDGWYWQRGNLEVSVSEAASGRVRGTQSWPIKESARDHASAKRRALNSAESILKRELRGAIVGLATSG